MELNDNLDIGIEMSYYNYTNEKLTTIIKIPFTINVFSLMEEPKNFQINHIRIYKDGFNNPNHDRISIEFFIKKVIFNTEIYIKMNEIGQIVHLYEVLKNKQCSDLYKIQTNTFGWYIYYKGIKNLHNFILENYLDILY